MTAEYRARDPGVTVRDPRGVAVSVDFRMCRYCGQRIVTAWGRRCQPLAIGDYCSKSCAEACHGFDVRITKERARGMVSFDPSKHDKPHDRSSHSAPITAPPRQPWELIDPEESQDNAAAVDALAAMRTAARIDPRLPGMLSMLADGATQEQVARRFGITQPRVVQLIARLRATVSK
jgi:hypothetical protein